MDRTTPASPRDLDALEARLRGQFLAGLAGDAQAYHAFLAQAARHLRAFLARRLFGWPDDVEDLVQECLLAMHNQRHSYQREQPLTAWVFAIARYKLIDLLAREVGARGPARTAGGRDVTVCGVGRCGARCAA